MREEVTLGWRNRLSIGVNQAELEMIILRQSLSGSASFARLAARSAIRSLPGAPGLTPFETREGGDVVEDVTPRSRNPRDLGHPA